MLKSWRIVIQNVHMAKDGGGHAVYIYNGGFENPVPVDGNRVSPPFALLWLQFFSIHVKGNGFGGKPGFNYHGSFRSEIIIAFLNVQCYFGRGSDTVKQDAIKHNKWQYVK